MTDIETAYQELEDSLLLVSPEEEGIARRKFAQRIAAEIKQQPDRADLYHRYGLCLYEIPDWTKEDIRQIENAFKRAIDLDKDAIFSRIFLTHFYYDEERYRESLAANCVVDCQSNPNVPVWRCCKMLELELCCLLILKGISQSEFQERLKRLQSLVLSVEDDILEAAWPNDLCQVLKENSYFAEGMDRDLLAWISSTR